MRTVNTLSRPKTGAAKRRKTIRQEREVLIEDSDNESDRRKENRG